MAISEMQRSNPSPSKCKSKLNQTSKWGDAKRNLVKKRLMSLSQKIKNEEHEDMDRPLICFKGEKTKTSNPPRCVDASTSAIDRAEEVRENLSQQFPSFSKLMLKSHVTGGFWLGLPKRFCDDHLPKCDKTIVLVDENEQKYDTKYLVEKNGLSGGWRGFSIAHQLVEGDVLVFQLIKPHKFKVYIVRASSLTELDGALGLLNLDVNTKPIDEEFVKMVDQYEEIPLMIEAENQKQLNSSSTYSYEEKNEAISISDDEPMGDDSSNDSNISGSDIAVGIKLSESLPIFKDVKSFENFSIHVDGLILDSEIPKHMRTKYYDLCRSQNMFLHHNLIAGLNINLSIGMISETINIADAIRASDATTPLNYLESWDKTLKAFEDLGMVVGFLRVRIRKLLDVSREFQAVIESKVKEKAEAEDMMRELEERLLMIKSLMRGMDDKIEALKMKQDRDLGIAFKEIAGSSW